MTDTFVPPPLPPPFPSDAHAPVLLAQGAEARLYKTHFLNPSIPAALKFRPSKPYRHPILDRRLTRQRILQEARCLAKLLKEGLPVPGVFSVDWNTESGDNANASGGAWLLMEWIEGPPVRQVVNDWEKWVKHCESTVQEPEKQHEYTKRAEEEIRSLLRKIGHVIGTLHKAGVIHGDLTTSNLLLRTQEDESVSSASNDANIPQWKQLIGGDIVLIDFGLASQSVQDEDRAVDLYVLERAFGSSHPRTEKFFDEVLTAYRGSYKNAASVLETLKKVRMRGRKRSMIG